MSSERAHGHAAAAWIRGASGRVHGRDSAHSCRLQVPAATCCATVKAARPAGASDVSVFLILAGLQEIIEPRALRR